jgi:hypothetical protein
VKKGPRSGYHSHLKTAGSTNETETRGKLSLTDVDPKELFDNFSCFVSVTESDEPIEQATQVGKKLEYEVMMRPLNFNGLESGAREGSRREERAG